MEYVFDHRSERSELLSITHDAYIERHRPSQAEHPRQQSFAFEFNKSLVPAHARALAASQDEGSDVRHRSASHAAIIHVAPEELV